MRYRHIPYALLFCTLNHFLIVTIPQCNVHAVVIVRLYCSDNSDKEKPGHVFNIDTMLSWVVLIHIDWIYGWGAIEIKAPITYHNNILKPILTWILVTDKMSSKWPLSLLPNLNLVAIVHEVNWDWKLLTHPEKPNLLNLSLRYILLSFYSN